jgi:transcription antitermination protein NusB
VNSEDGQSPLAKGRSSKRSRDSSAEIAARRHQARMLALQVLYEVDLTNHDPDEAMSRAFNEHGPLTDDVTSRVQTLVGGVLARRGELDPILAAAAPARALEEQAAIERNVLRLAAYELLHEPKVPPKVAINEGVELAKRFGGENSGKFVNGVLRTVLEGHPRPTPDSATANGG